MLVYAISALGAALAGIIQSTQAHTALATYGPFGTELDVIAAGGLGGTSIMGGNGQSGARCWEWSSWASSITE
jgi:ribose/xylose/arabinose/galactoside ABC-type transport system permease subunit